MRDDESPQGSPNDPEAPPPRYGEYAPPGWTPPEPQASWAPPPPPGLLPLRPLFLADVIVGAFRLIRRHPRPTFWFSFALSLVASLVAVGLLALVAWNVLRGIDPAAPPETAELRGIIAALAVAALAAILIQLALTAISQAVAIAGVARATLGERLTLGALWSRARGRVGTLIAWLLLLGGAIAFIVLLGALGLAELALTGGVAGAVAAAGIGLVGGLAILVVAVWLGTKLAFVPALIILERRTIGAAVRRSWAMTRGGFWRILGITLLVNLIVQVGAQILTIPITFLNGLVERTQVAGALDSRVIVLLIVTLVVQAVITAVAVVVQSAVPAILYLDTRMRQEGFDARLRETVEQVHAGRAADDPFD